jgi:hypothetical protein
VIGANSSPAPIGRSSRSTIWPALAFVLVLLPYELLAAFAHPGADDLTYALDTRRDGYRVALRDQYFQWNGRYTSNLLELGGPMVWGSVVLYKLTAAAMIPATVLALYVFIRSVVGPAWTREQVATSALGMTAIFLGGVPALGESIYWYTGSVTYQLSSIMLIVQAAVIVATLSGQRLPTTRRVAAVALLAAATVGMNEVAMLMTVVFQGALLLTGVMTRRRGVITESAIALSVAVAGALVVWFAPGNAVRAAMFSARHQLGRSVAMTVLQTVRFGSEWSTNGSLLLASLLYLPLGAELTRTNPGVRALGSKPTSTCLLAGAFAVIPLALFPPYWASGDLGQHRTISVAYGVFLPLWFAALTAVLASGWLRPPHGWIADRPVRVVMFGLLIVSLAFTHNGYRVALDFASGKPAAFDREMSARLISLNACRAAPSRPCVIPPRFVTPETFSLPDISSDPNDWVNAGYASYFGLSQVVSRPQ